MTICRAGRSCRHSLLHLLSRGATLAQMSRAGRVGIAGARSSVKPTMLRSRSRSDAALRSVFAQWSPHGKARTAQQPPPMPTTSSTSCAAEVLLAANTSHAEWANPGHATNNFQSVLATNRLATRYLEVAEVNALVARGGVDPLQSRTSYGTTDQFLGTIAHALRGVATSSTPASGRGVQAFALHTSMVAGQRRNHWITILWEVLPR
jgi:hypothetical protein